MSHLKLNPYLNFRNRTAEAMEFYQSVLGGEPLRKYFEGLSAGGTVSEPLVKAPWGDEFGMLTDKFGIHWLVNIVSAENAQK